MKSIPSIVQANQNLEVDEEIEHFESDDFFFRDKITLDNQKPIMETDSKALLHLIKLGKAGRKQVNWKKVFSEIVFTGDEREGKKKVLYHYYNKRSFNSRKETKRKQLDAMSKEKNSK